MEDLARRNGSRVSIEVIREARRREQDSRWLGSAGAVLLRRYHGKYVAVKNKRVVASSSTMRGLYRKIDQLDSGMVLIAKVERPTLLSSLQGKEGLQSLFFHR